MRIVFSEIVKETRFDEPVAAQSLDLGYGYGATVEPTVVSFIATPLKKGGVRIAGAIPYRAALPCTRCLAPVALAGETLFSLNYYPTSAEPPAEAEQEIPLEETEDIFTEEDGITPEALVAQQLYLEFPEKVLCREDCPGLCPDCGADLNAGPCPCPREGVGLEAGPIRLTDPDKE
jgi:uncharacterized metal-binding protein YceD (DUF177 family)